MARRPERRSNPQTLIFNHFTIQEPRFEIEPEADCFLPPQTPEEYQRLVEHQQPQIDIVAKMFDELKERTGQTEDGVVLMEALAMLDWATQEAGRKRLIISVEADGSNPLQLNTPSLAHCRQS